MRIGKKIFIIFAFLTGIFLSAPILAQQPAENQMFDMPSEMTDATQTKAMPESEILPDVKKLHKTHPEKILFTHYKLAGVEPDFDHFAKISPLVKRAQEIDKSPMTYSEFNRIFNAFHLHDEKAPFVIQTKLNVDEYSSLQDLIVFDVLYEL